MKALKRVARVVWGDEVEQALRPLIAVGLAGSLAVGFALAPFTGLLVRDAAGDTAMWTFFAAMSVVSAVVGVLAVRLAFARRVAPAPAV
jgi:hypothetical protein